MISRTRAAIWSIVCPGVGEYKLGHRALGLTLAMLFLVACAWLMVLAYSLVYGIAEQVKTADPSLNAPPLTAGDAVTTSMRLSAAIYREYMVQRGAIHERLKWPLGVIFVLYAWSVAQAFCLGTPAPRPADGAKNDAPAG